MSMITLLELVKGLDWPEGAICVVQDVDGDVKWLPSMPCQGVGCYGGSSSSPDFDGDWWFVAKNRDVACKTPGFYVAVVYEVALSSDWETSIVTKKMWEAAQI